MSKMYSLKVVPSEPKKLVEAEHLKYIAIRKLLKEYDKNKDVITDIRNIHYSGEDMRRFVKEYRKELKECYVDYVFTYKTTNRVWKNMPGMSKGLDWKFKISSFSDPTILKNKRHEMIHKRLFLGREKTKIEWFKEMKSHIRVVFQQARAKAREVRIERRERSINSLGDRVRYNICGATMYTKPKMLARGESPKGKINNQVGVIMKFLKSKDKHVVFEEKKPQTKDNYIGLELEFFCDLDRNDLSFQLAAAGLGKYVCLKEDGSIQQDSGTYDHELCILAKEKEVHSVVKEVCDVLKEANAKVNKSCGLHVHIDMRNRDHEIAFNNLACSQNILFAMNPFSRQAGTFCKRVNTRDFKKAASQDRYFGINAKAYNGDERHRGHKTIEIRIHSGTVMEEKINNWVRLLLVIANKKAAVDKSSTSLKAFINQYEIEAKLAKYMFERIAKFSGENNKNAEEKGAA